MGRGAGGFRYLDYFRNPRRAVRGYLRRRRRWPGGSAGSPAPRPDEQGRGPAEALRVAYGFRAGNAAASLPRLLGGLSRQALVTAAEDCARHSAPGDGSSAAAAGVDEQDSEAAGRAVRKVRASTAGLHPENPEVPGDPASVSH